MAQDQIARFLKPNKERLPIRSITVHISPSLSRKYLLGGAEHDTREETRAVVARIGTEKTLAKKPLYSTIPPLRSSLSVAFSPSSPRSDHVASDNRPRF